MPVLSLIASLMKDARWRVILVVGFAFFMDYFIYGLVVPLTPFSPAGAMTEAKMALLYGSYAIGVFCATPIFGYFSDGLGYRRSMLIGVALSTIATILFWFAGGFPPLLLARLFQGAASAATWTAGLALIAEQYPANRVTMMGYALVGSTAGSVLGPLVGGTLFEFGGYDLPFIVTTVLVVIDATMRAVFIPASHARSGASPNLRLLLTDREILVASLAVVLAALGWGIIEPLLPGYLERIGATPGSIGLIFTIATVAYGLSAPVVSWASNRIPIKRVIAAGILGMAITLPLLGVMPSILLTGGALCLVSVAFAFALNPTSAELGNAVDRRGLSCYAAVYAVYNIAYSVGMMATNTFAAAVATHLGFLPILLCASAALLGCTPLLLKDARLATAVTPSSKDQPA